jgi:hypothetical protein
VKALEAAAGWLRAGQACLVQKAGDHGRALVTRESSGGDEFAPRCAAVAVDRYPVEEDPHQLQSELRAHFAYAETRRRLPVEPSVARTRFALCPTVSSAASSDETFTVTVHPESIKTEKATGETLPTTVPRAIVPPDSVAALTLRPRTHSTWGGGGSFRAESQSVSTLALGCECTAIGRECTPAARRWRRCSLPITVRAVAERTWLILDEVRASAVAALCETIVPGSGRVEPAVYIDAKLAMVDGRTRAATLVAIDSLADVADGAAEGLAEWVATPEFLMLRALACEAFHSDFIAPGAKGPSAWEEIDFRFPLARQIQHDWSFMGVPG